MDIARSSAKEGGERLTDEVGRSYSMQLHQKGKGGFRYKAGRSRHRLQVDNDGRGCDRAGVRRSHDS